MLIRTKILATVGPASSSPQKLRELILAGCDAFRINFSHGDNENRGESLDEIRKLEKELNRPLAICADLCGPKIRVGSMTGGGVLLVEGQEVIIQRDVIEGTTNRISTTLPELVDDVRLGEPLLLDDGKLKLEVVKVSPPDEIVCKVIVGGILGSGKGINLPGTQLNLSALTEKDRRDVDWIVQHDFDYVALSFVQKAEDVNTLRELLKSKGCDAHIIAKIEKPQAIDDLENIVAAADVIMVARGDLGVEMDIPAVPATQKQIALVAQWAGKPCIIATQMLESMISSPVPTRAEVSDVANAVLDHADAVMLSGETAVGEYPVEAVTMMNDTVSAIQTYHDKVHHGLHVVDTDEPTTAAIAAAVGNIIKVDDIAAVAVFTASGTTARILAKNRIPCPILALSPDEKIVRRICLYYGITSHKSEVRKHTNEILEDVSKYAVELGVAEEGQKIVVVSGRPLGKDGFTNTLIVHTVGANSRI